MKLQTLFSVGDNEKTIFQLVRMKKKLIFSCRPGGGKMTNRDPSPLPPPRGWFLPDRLWSHMDHAWPIFLKSPWCKDVGNDNYSCQMGAWPYPPWLVSCNERSVFVPEWTTPQLSSMCLTLSPLVSLMYQTKCIHPRVNNSPILGPKFMVVCYSVVWYCMLGHGMVWVLSIDGCSLQMGAKHPSVENTHL